MYAVFGLYILAKAFELQDAPIYELGHLVSGHFLKHLAAGAAASVIDGCLKVYISPNGTTVHTVQ